jgi:hypothetical protein
MAQPSVGQVSIPVAAQDLTIQYKPKNLIGDSVFPIVPVATLNTKVLKYSKANLFRLQDGDLYRSEGTMRRRFNYNIDTQQINPRQISAEASVTDELIDIAQMPGQYPLQPIIDATQLIITKIDNFKEKLVADIIYGNTWIDGAAGGTAPSVSAGWSKTDSTNSMIADIFAAKDAIRKSTGVIPNKLILDYATFLATQSNIVLSDKIKYTQKAVMTADLIASALELDEVLIGRSIIITGNDNKKTTPTTASIWNPSGKGNAFLFYQEAPGLRALGAGYQFRLPYMGSMRFMRGYRDEQVSSTIYQITEQIEIAPVALDVGYAWKNTVTA